MEYLSKQRINRTWYIAVFCRIADFYLEIEQEVVLRLFDFFKTLSSRLESRIFQHMGSTHHQLFPDFEFSRNAPVDVGKHLYSTNITMLNKDNKRSCLLPKMVPTGAPWQQIHLLARKQKKIYVESFDMAPIKFTLRLVAIWFLRRYTAVCYQLSLFSFLPIVLLNPWYITSDNALLFSSCSFSSSPWMLRNGVLTSGESLIHVCPNFMR